MMVCIETHVSCTSWYCFIAVQCLDISWYCSGQPQVWLVPTGHEQ